MAVRPTLLALALALTTSADADTQRDFQNAYAAYREAAAASRYGDALEHAEQARKLGESLYPDDPRKTATLVFNHGAVLGKLTRHDEAYPILKRARRLMRQAFGEDAPEMLNVELALLDSAPPGRVQRVLKETLKLADLHRAGDVRFIAGIKVKGALRLWRMR